MRALICCALTVLACSAQAGPEEDRLALRKVYEDRFPGVPIEAHKDGVYAIDEGARTQWQEIEEFPPYEIAVDEGEALFAEPFPDGAGFVDCFGDGAVKARYPQFDESQATVVTLEMAINACRTAHGATAWANDSAELTNLASYMAFVSRGQIIAVPTPASAAALKAYEAGKQFYTSRRGQLNFACTSCHVQLAGNLLRAERLSASVGHVTHWPVYRFKWEEMGGLHLRFQECNSQVGAEPFELQSEMYRNLEYFLSYMANGLPLNGPATRK
jgi:L-cysteine S-thiosulfotransferase